MEHNCNVTEYGTGTKTLRVCRRDFCIGWGIEARVSCQPHGARWMLRPRPAETVRRAPCSSDNIQLRARTSSSVVHSRSRPTSRLPSEPSTNRRVNIETRRKTGTRGALHGSTPCSTYVYYCIFIAFKAITWLSPWYDNSEPRTIIWNFNWFE